MALRDYFSISFLIFIIYIHYIRAVSKYGLQVPNVFNNPDLNLDTHEIITRNGYASKLYTVITVDGYILMLHRIPYGKAKDPNKKRQPVILQHGLIGSSLDFVIGGNKSLAFILSDAGYDVWISNSRGNKYSKQHVHLKTDQKEFWDFSWDEMAKYDLSAVIDYVADRTNQGGNILYVGYSMGTTIFFALISEQIDYNNKIKAMFAMAPTVGLKNVRGPMSFFAKNYNMFSWAVEGYRYNELSSNNYLIQILAGTICTPLYNIICKNFIFLLSGFDDKQMDASTLISAIASYASGGTSIKTLLQFAQAVTANGRFQHYDYGRGGNLKRYGSEIPLEYNISKVIVPVAVLYANNDWIAVPEDVEELYNKLPNPVDLYEVPYEQFNHADFIWAKDAPKLVYDHLLKLMGQYHTK